MSANTESTHRHLSEQDWAFIWQVLEGTKLDVPLIRANVERMHKANGEADITRLKGQRAVLAGLLDKALVTLHDVKRTTDDKDTLANLTDLISWSTNAVNAVWIEDGFLHRPTGGTSNGN